VLTRQQLGWIFACVGAAYSQCHTVSSPYRSAYVWHTDRNRHTDWHTDRIRIGIQIAYGSAYDRIQICTDRCKNVCSYGLAVWHTDTAYDCFVLVHMDLFIRYGIRMAIRFRCEHGSRPPAQPTGASGDECDRTEAAKSDLVLGTTYEHACFTVYKYATPRLHTHAAGHQTQCHAH
jgi:hypothetical protein